MTPTDLLSRLWHDYTQLTPQAARIHALLAARGEVICNDHVALRTFDRAGLGLDAMARPFEALGWQRRDRYRFDDKHLWAAYWQHADPALPKVFISELVVDELSPTLIALVDRLIAQLPPGFADRDDLALAGRPWSLDHATYRALLAESEYAAWVAAFGWRVNHFTVDVGRLTTFDDLAGVNTFLTERGFELNTAGGVVKGTLADHLEQSSTRADAVTVAFADGEHEVPSCYYEFARRYPLPSGELFHGFVPTSADKLFHSTDVAR